MKADSSLLVYWGIPFFFFTVLLVAGPSCFEQLIRESRREKLLKSTWFFYGINLLFSVGAFGLRWVQTGHVPLANTYETLLLFMAVLQLSYLFLFRRDKKKHILGALSGVQCVCASAASLLKTAPQNLPPALENSWLTFHVVTCIVAYAAFTLSFVAACFYLAGKKQPEMNLLLYKSVLLGIPFLTLGILSGAIWADHAWGSYWSWDPKETWALICWLYYILFLHLRLRHLVSPRILAFLSIVGFCVVIFTFFGVNYLLGGLHSYV